MFIIAILLGLVLGLLLAVLRGALLYVMFQIVNITFLEQFSFWQCVGIGIIASLLFQSNTSQFTTKSLTTRQ